MSPSLPGNVRLRILLTNDDGIDAPGLSALGLATEGLGHRVVVAPSVAWSCRGHAITTDQPIEVRCDGTDRFAVSGSPADCVRLGLHHLASEVDWVLAGINAGGNLGADIHHSGTVAAAREAVLHGRRAIAFSHYLIRGRPIDWDRAARWTRSVLAILLRKPWEPGTLWNVNLPHPEPGSPDPPIVSCPVDPSPLPLRFLIDGEFARYQGDYHGRPRQPGGDIDTCFSGRISVSRVSLFDAWHETGHLAEKETDTA
jgi:5'-nucleotidase